MLTYKLISLSKPVSPVFREAQRYIIMRIIQKKILFFHINEVINVLISSFGDKNKQKMRTVFNEVINIIIAVGK